MLTPWTIVEVVHAVQRPSARSPVHALSILDRTTGQTSALPSAQVHCSIDSTDRLDLYGEWHEPVDDPSKDGSAPGNRQRRDVAFQVKVTGPKQYAGTSGVAPGAPEHSVTSTDLIAINSGQEASRSRRTSFTTHVTAVSDTGSTRPRVFASSFLASY